MPAARQGWPAAACRGAKANTSATWRRISPAGGSIPQTGWTLYPGCDKSWARCQALGNSANFRGFPHMPKTNPAMVAVSNTPGSGSKK